ncbi:hypothetical protein LTR36_007737 [Oleoguttula mirabilis]|uniref:Uncharacterized protein n=1 Tax=Oleoguttula mirabilis TaxID=1507867 RepID=A0AAV9JUR7_9PEZI|nr:hypothetical protein LTR36_007737 [Oleoguttula mirabilis]
MTSTIRVQLDAHELAKIESCERDIRTLPRADGGKAAWLFLTACFMLEALVWGFPFSFGIFQVYYSNHKLFSEQAGGIPSIGTTTTGAMYFGAPFVAVAAQCWPKLRRPSMMLGVMVMVVALLAASFCNSVCALIATEGVLYAIVGLVTYYPSMQYIGEWLVAKKGFAYGMM